MKKRKTKQIIANQIVLKDSEGKVRLILDANNPAGPSIDLFSSSGSPLLSVKVDDDDTSKVNFFDAKGSVKLAIGTSTQLGAGISFHDNQGKPIGLIRYRTDHALSFSLFSESNQADRRHDPG